MSLTTDHGPSSPSFLAEPGQVPTIDDQTGTPPLTPRGKLAAIRDTVGAVVGAVMGLVPHVMHHIGLVAGAAVVTGALGNGLFFLVGLVFSIPLLRRLYRRFNSWRAPAIAVAVFTALFSISAFVVGPAISQSDQQSQNTPAPAETEDHEGHHPTN